MSKFYYPDGTECSFESFVDYYSKMYFYWNDKEQEDRIITILEKGITNKSSIDDITSIMEWKTGRKATDGKISTRRNEKYIVLNDILNNFPNKNTIDSFVDFVLNHRVDGIGPVYTITLLFFASKGTYPIYDRFADLALKAIKDNANPLNASYSYTQLPDNFKKRYNKYIEDLNIITADKSIQFTGNTDESRKLDRALWVYGHMFSK